MTDDPWVHRRAKQLVVGCGITASALTGDELAVKRRGCEDEVILLLLTSRANDRLDAIRAIAKLQPGVPLLVMMPAEASGVLLRRALKGGADGIVLDGELTRTLVPTARAVLAGQVAVPQRLRRQIAPRALSHREKQILALVVHGYTNSQIARELFVAESTVKTHLSSALAKLDTGSRAEAAALILDPEEGYGLGIPLVSEQ